MPKDINLSNGETKKNCVLGVRNVTGIAEEKGFRLFWQAAMYGKNMLREDKIFLITENGLRRFK